MKKIIFRCCQISLFILITCVIFSFAYYFPNMPPLIRHAVVKHRIDLRGDDASKPDERFLKWFNRDPDRDVPSEPNIVVAPADGFVDGIETVNDRVHVIIEMRYTDVHVQRIPMAGKIIRVDGDGLKLPKGMEVGDYTLDKMTPYQKMTTIQTEIGDIMVRQITSFFANRIEVFVKEEQAVQRGERLGRIIAGSTVIVELPKIVRVLVKLEQNVLGGETIIGRY